MGQARAMEQGKGVHGDSPTFTAPFIQSMHL